LRQQICTEEKALTNVQNNGEYLERKEFLDALKRVLIQAEDLYDILLKNKSITTLILSKLIT